MAGSGLAAVSALAMTSIPAERAAKAAAPAVEAPVSYDDLTREIVRGGEVGFVVTRISYSLGPDAKDSGACPNGMNGGVRGLIEAYAKSPAGQRRPGESDRAYQGRLNMSVFTAPNGKNLCMNPEAGAPDPGWRMVSGKVPVDGLDLDGQDGGKRPAPGTCAHENFQGTHGERGIDNQFYRMIGCTSGYQSTGQANGFDTEMYTGSWGILIRLRGVDDLRNDPDVEVGIYANADPIQLSAARAALPFATYAITQDSKYRATTRGRIVNGVLTIDPVDVRFMNFVNSMKDDRILRDARLRLAFTADGGMEGFLAGYWPIESAYDLSFGSRNSQAAKGGLAPERLRMGTAMGRAGALGHSCHGAYFALQAAADGHRDPATGRCTSISTQYRIKVAPAFVVDAKTNSMNTPPSAS
ncbi:MAG: hypothetical protein ACTHLU_01975 [Novosphingobium sp.]